MKRKAILILLLAGLCGCRSAPERAPVPLTLPEESKTHPYKDLVSRARALAMAANEAFYVDRWADIEESARGLEQSARFFKSATEIPDNRASEVSLRSEELAKEAAELRQAAQAKDAARVNAVLQKVHRLVREMR